MDGKKNNVMLICDFFYFKSTQNNYPKKQQQLWRCECVSVCRFLHSSYYYDYFSWWKHTVDALESWVTFDFNLILQLYYGPISFLYNHRTQLLTSIAPPTGGRRPQPNTFRRRWAHKTLLNSVLITGTFAALATSAVASSCSSFQRWSRWTKIFLFYVSFFGASELNKRAIHKEPNKENIVVKWTNNIK